MTIEEIQEMINKLQCELNLAVEKKIQDEKKAEEEKNKGLSQKYPAYAEMRARFNQVCEKYKVSVFWKDVEYILAPGHAVEQYVKRVDPKYRYKPIKSAFKHERTADTKTRVVKRKSKKDNSQEELELN